MNLQLAPPHVGFSFTMDHTDPVFLAGSCFVNEIGGKLERYKFKCLRNPFGIVYNPWTLTGQIEKLLDDEPVQGEELVFDQGLWHSLWHHGRFSGENKKQVIEGIQKAHRQGREALLSANYVFLTFGSSLVYRHLKQDQIVSNCHRIPGGEFSKERLGLTETEKYMTRVLERFFTENQEAKVILTISPVRHLRDGLIDNNRSKAILLLLCEALEIQFEQVYYLPVYEYMLDVLRDYRFFARDLTHPNQLAVVAIWDWYGRQFFTEKTSICIYDLDKLLRAVAHRPMYSSRKNLEYFAGKQLEYISQLNERYPQLDFSTEKAHFRALIQR